MMKHQLVPLPPLRDRQGASPPAATGRWPASRAPSERGLLPQESQRIPESSAPGPASLPAKKPTGKAGAIWQSMLGFFLKGFALYGASLHWVATTAVTAIASEVDARQRRNLRGAEDRNLSRSLRMPSTSVGFASAGREVDRYRFIHPGWPAMIWRAIASRATRWRREREIRKAVVALAELDNRMLRDMGIPDSSQIERIVRYGRDS